MFNIEYSELLVAISLMLIFEGVIPFINPEGMRRIFFIVSKMDNVNIRYMGLSSMIFGIILLYIVR